MIKEIKNYEEVHSFVKKLSYDESTASYPRILDDEMLINMLESSLIKENNNLVACYDNSNTLVGVSSYLWEDEEKYMQTDIFLIEDNYDHIADEMVDYFKNQFKGYEIHIGFPKGNIEAITYFSEKNKYDCIEDSVVTHIKYFKDYKSKFDSCLVHINKENFSDYSSFHDSFAKKHGMYYDAKNLLSDIDEFGILGLKEEEEYVASIFFKVNKKISGIYGLFLGEKYKSMDKEDIMIDGMMAYLSNIFEQIDEVIYFINQEDQDELKSALKMGFEEKEAYCCFLVK